MPKVATLRGLEWCGSHKIEPSRGGCGLARVPIDPNKFEAKQSTGLASPALVPAAFIRRVLSFALPLGYGLEPGSRGSQARRTPSGAGVALVLELYWVVGNPCINMVQSYRLVGPIIATNSYVMIWNIRNTEYRSSATSGAPMERPLAAKPLGLCSVFWISQIMNI